MTRAAVLFDRRTWSPGRGDMTAPLDRSMRITVGALNESHEGFQFASPFRGSLSDAQEAAERLAHGAAAYLHDVISGEHWHRPVGGAWRGGEH